MSQIIAPAVVRIHIDREPFESPNPTTGVALYALGDIPENRELFREVSGDDEDVLVLRDDTAVRLVADEHFYSQKTFTIRVNTEPFEVVERYQTFDQIVKLAYPVPPEGQNIMFTVMYRHGPKENPKGSLLEGQSVKVKDGMIFDVTPTDRS
jgi:hypothetical protein